MVFFAKTILDGERVAVWDAKGSVKTVDGPKRIGTLFKRVQRLHKHFADHSEYLRVTQKDGAVVILPGPCALFEDPVTHERVTRESARLVDASEALVVYKGAGSGEKVNGDHEKDNKINGESNRVVRRVVRGPARFIPQADEWIHHFEWSGRPKDGSKVSYQPRQLKFDHLKVVPSSAYHNVNEVRTNDDTLITVKLMIFFELKDIEKMLDATNDPIGDFINAASADVIAFCAQCNYESFLNETHKLNDRTTFEQLTSRAKHIGYEITKVVFRGFQAGDKLQAMHDNAIQERTRLRLLEETQQQQQRAADMELHAKTRRATQQAELAASEASQQADLSMVSRKARLAEQQLEDEASIEKAKRQHAAKLEQEAAASEAALARERASLELMKASHAEQLGMMRAMHEMGVDLTKVMVSQHEHPDRVIKLETNQAPAENGKSGGGGKAEAKGLLSALQLNL